MQIIKGKNSGFTLQLIKSDNTYEDEATVTYSIYENDLTTIAVSAQTAAWNSTHYCYYDLLDVSIDWTDQTIGNYILKWSISDADEFASTMVEDICVLTDASSGSGLTTAQEDKIDAIQADLDDPDQYKADVSSLAGDVWDEIGSDHDIPLSTGWLLSSIYSSSVAGDVTSTPTSGALVRTVNFGNSKSNLSTVGYTLYNADGGEYRARTESGVYSVGTSGGCYAANITFDDDWQGSILWDTGDDSRAWSSEDFNGNVFKFVNDINIDVEKILGLVHSNIYMDNPSYDSSDNLESLRVRIYTSAESVGTSNNVLSTYQVSAVGDGSGKFSSWKQVEI